jgi:hypothetical protein
MVILGLTGMKEGIGKNLVDAFLLSLLSVPLLSLFGVKTKPRPWPSRRTFRVEPWKRKWS